MTERHEEACTLKCYACGRPHDNFGHAHVDSGDGSKEVLALCLSCLTGLASYFYPRIQAYRQGGIMFDVYLREKARAYRQRFVGAGTPMPDFMQEVMESLRRAEHGEQDDEGE